MLFWLGVFGCSRVAGAQGQPWQENGGIRGREDAFA